MALGGTAPPLWSSSGSSRRTRASDSGPAPAPQQGVDRHALHPRLVEEMAAVGPSSSEWAAISPTIEPADAPPMASTRTSTPWSSRMHRARRAARRLRLPGTRRASTPTTSGRRGEHWALATCPAAPGPNPGRRLVAIGISTHLRGQVEAGGAAAVAAVIDSSPLALVEFGLDTRIRLWNPAAERIFGWTREEMVGRGGLPWRRRRNARELDCSSACARASG